MTHLQCFPLAPNHITPCVQLEKRRSDEKAERDRLNDIYLELIEKQRAYYKTVRDFQEVGCFTNTHNTAFIFHMSLIHVLYHFLSKWSRSSSIKMQPWLELLKEDNECNLVSLLQGQVLGFY